MKPDVQKRVERQLKSLDTSEKSLIFSAEKKSTTCDKCSKYDGKVYLESDLSKPALPIHPNCHCYYLELYLKTSANSRNRIKRSATVRVDNSPGMGGLRISGIDDMLEKLEKAYSPGSLSELIISNHGGNEGFFPMGNGDDLRYINGAQLARLKRLLAPDAIVDIRICYAADSDEGHVRTQQLADKLGVKVRGYEGPVSPYGTRPGSVKPDNVHPRNYFQRFFPDHKPKIFFPESK